MPNNIFKRFLAIIMAYTLALNLSHPKDMALVQEKEDLEDELLSHEVYLKDADMQFGARFGKTLAIMEAYEMAESAEDMAKYYALLLDTLSEMRKVAEDVSYSEERVYAINERLDEIEAYLTENGFMPFDTWDKGTGINKEESLPLVRVKPNKNPKQPKSLATSFNRKNIYFKARSNHNI